MKILVADDDSGTRRLLQATLTKWGYEVTLAVDGEAAWEILQRPNPPLLAILDWLMPKLDGVEICRKARLVPALQSAQIILLTSRTTKEDVVKGLEAGADDYVTKPFDLGELRARVQVGARIVRLQMDLADRLKKLQDALAHVKQLHGLLPICAYCKKIRDDKNYWHQVEIYVSQNADVRFSHGVCPECLEKVTKDLEENPIYRRQSNE
jgi:sigma-B regulation protein RsbU (phosphoserine phosphatase)